MKKEDSFFQWLVNLFKKKEEVKIEPTPEQLAEEAKWNLIKSKYQLEYLKEHNAYFVKYQHHTGEFLYLRRWTDDYTLEHVRGNAIRLSHPEHLDLIIKLHQEWIAGGHIFMNFD